MLDISLICCTYNNSESLKRTLESLAMVNVSGINLEFIIVNNNSNDDTEKVCLDFIKAIDFFPVKHIIETKIGLSKARNRGVTNSSGGYVVFIDDDVLCTENLLQEIMKEVKHSKPECFGTRILLKYPKVKPVWLHDKIAYIYGCIDLGKENKPIVDRNISPLGPCIGFHRKVFEKLGLFDELKGLKGNTDTITRGEESDMIKRIRDDGGMAIYIGTTTVYHVVRKDRLVKTWFLQRFENNGIIKGMLDSKQELSKAKYYYLISLLITGFNFFLAEDVRFYVECKKKYYKAMIDYA